MRSNRLLVSAFVVVSAAASQASDGLQLVGFSVKQLSLGGAVTANPLSPMTVLTNPAGLTYIPDGTEFSLGFAFPSIHAGFPAASADSKSSKDFQLLPAVAIAAPTKSEKTRFGFAVGLVAGSGIDFAWPTLGRSAFSDLQIIRIAPGASVKLSDKVSVGGALNLNVGRVSLSNEGFGDSTLPAAFGHGTEMVGIGATLGVMANVSENVRLGASYTTKSNFPDAKYPSAVGDYRGKFNFPQQAAIGVCVNPDKPTTFSADLKWINNAQTLKDLMIYGPGLPAGGANLGTHWRDQIVLALGVQHRFENGWTIRGGYNHVNKPYEDKYASRNIMLPAIATDHFSLGLECQAGDRWSFETVFVYQPQSTVFDGQTKLTNRNTTLGLGATVKF